MYAPDRKEYKEMNILEENKSRKKIRVSFVASQLLDGTIAIDTTFETPCAQTDEFNFVWDVTDKMKKELCKGLKENWKKGE